MMHVIQLTYGKMGYKKMWRGKKYIRDYPPIFLVSCADFGCAEYRDRRPSASTGWHFHQRTNKSHE